MTEFRARVLDVVRGIKAGSTMSYAEVANAAGSPGAFRSVGSVLKANFDPQVPCHRVIKSDGTMGEYNRGGPYMKLQLLRQEGATIRGVK